MCVYICISVSSSMVQMMRKKNYDFHQKNLSSMLYYKKQGVSAHSITAACWLVSTDGNQLWHFGRLVACNPVFLP